MAQRSDITGCVERVKARGASGECVWGGSSRPVVAMGRSAGELVSAQGWLRFVARMCAVDNPARVAHRAGPPLRIGFVDLLDAAPLIAAQELGFFRDEDLTVILRRQLGWGNIRDRLTFGDLDAAHALLGMPLFSHLRLGGFIEPLVAVMNLSAGGNAITMGRRLINASVRDANDLARHVRTTSSHARPVLAHVFNCSMHHFLLRQWLASGGVNPDRDVHLRVFPPNQMPGHMARGHVDGFCAGEPWNTIVERDGVGEITAMTTDILPDHPEKILATTARFAKANRAVLMPMIRAVLRGCQFCSDSKNRGALAELLARPEYLNLPAGDLYASLSPRGGRARVTAVQSFATAHTFPSRNHTAWIASQMVRWGQLPAESNVYAMAENCCDASAYRAAADSLDLEFPDTDSPPMPLHGGTYDASAFPPANAMGAPAEALHA